MPKCTLHHTGISISAPGVIKNNLVYLEEDGKLYFPEEMGYARDECDNGFMQFEVEGKWGFADIFTGQIKIEPVWDYAGPFYCRYAHVVVAVESERLGSNNKDVYNSTCKHGYIDKNGKIVIPLEYDRAKDVPYKKCFKVAKNEKWGMIDQQNRIVIPLEWDSLKSTHYNNYLEVAKNEKWGIIDTQNRIIIPAEWDELYLYSGCDLIFCAKKDTSSELCIGTLDILTATVFNAPPVPTYAHRLKWGVCDLKGNLIVKPELDEVPRPYEVRANHNKRPCLKKYYIMKKDKRYGVICEDGEIVAEIKHLKKEAIALIKDLIMTEE